MSEGTAGCSQGIDNYPDHWKDIVGAVDFLAQRGARRTILIGASIGAMASLYAAAGDRVHPVGVLEFGGINNASGYDLTRAQIRRIRGHKLFLSSRADIYGGAQSAREWYRWATPPKRLVLVPASEHGTDLLRAGSSQRHALEQLIAEFVDSAARGSE